MARQYLVPNWGHINETATRMYLIPGQGFVSETQTSDAVGSASGIGAASAVGVGATPAAGSAAGVGAAAGVAPSTTGAGSAQGSAAVSGIGVSFATAIATVSGTSTAAAVSVIPPQNVSFLLWPLGWINETLPRQYQIAGSVFISENQTNGNAGRAAGAGTASGVGGYIAASVGLSAGTGDGNAASVSTALSVGTAPGSGVVLGSGVGAVIATGSADGSATAVAVGAFQATTLSFYCNLDDLFNYISLVPSQSTNAVGTANGMSVVQGQSSIILSAIGTASGSANAEAIATPSVNGQYDFSQSLNSGLAPASL